MNQDDTSAEGRDTYEPDTESQGTSGGSGSEEAPNPETGVGIGMGTEATSFEPEEDPEAASTAADDQAESPSEG